VLPDAAIGHKPYQTVVEAMKDQKVEAVAQGVISRREQLVLLRPVDDVLLMTALIYAAEVKEPSEFRSDISRVSTSKQELQLAKQLIGAMTAEKFDLASYRDEYNEKLTQLIEAKVEGKELVAPAARPAPKVINLMDAIKASMKTVKAPAVKRAKAASKGKTSALRQVVAANRKTAPRKRKLG
jgi:DNA end-binding protein Ku